MRAPITLLPPTSSLPRLRCSSPDDLTLDKIDRALHDLRNIYCPLPRAAAFSKPSLPPSQDDSLLVPRATTANASSGASTPQPVDSGYASGDEQEADPCDTITDQDHVAELRQDPYERQFAVRWLTTLISRADELLPDADEDAQQRLVDDASYILASFSTATDADEDEGSGAIEREFCFPQDGQAGDKIEVRLTDGTPATGTDHTDVGLQSWGASIVVSDLMCSYPERFDLTVEKLGRAPRIVELGAGTGLVGITMAKLLPRLGVPCAKVIATDYHPAVLENLQSNIVANFTERDNAAVETCLLDWSNPCLDPPLDIAAEMLIATDVVYAPEHAAWLRDCAAKLLARDGVFWLIASVRPNGRFEGVTDTVETSFADVKDCPKSEDGKMVLRIVGKERLEKRKGVGRADEVGYKVFRIGWVEME
ncbi:methyltransferase domain-containing protein [Diaporthe amygdali]|uniref:methyltransferase domain-containing protein n=1 Tax=Phomopsis amygdali TaxID=1214568 RepID=UPI0022FEF442|nr:methyltransferase domain-containing protein [Diaporthe amygdali]KAJ0117455.1 methyltransferase domain-containing protein [Diaporthe amygdali]